MPIILSSKNKGRDPVTSALKKNLGLVVCLVMMHAAGFAQHDTAVQAPASDSTRRHYDSATNKLFNTIRQFGADLQKKNIHEYSEDTIASRQDETVAEIRRLTIEGKGYLDNGPDTSGLTAELFKIEHWYEIAADGVLIHTGTLQTNRNLETSYTIMNELLTRVLRRKSSLDNHYRRLNALRNKIDSLHKVDVLYQFSSDSTVLMRYVKKLVVVSEEIKPIDSAFKQTLIVVSELQTTVNRFVNKVRSGIAQIELFQDQVSNSTFSRESTNLGGEATFSRPFSNVIEVSLHKGFLAFVFYIRNEVGRIVLVVLLVYAATVILIGIKRNLRSKNLLDEGGGGLRAEIGGEQRVLRYPALSATVIVLNLLQFIFPNPPFVFNAVIWTSSAIMVTILFRDLSVGNRRVVWILLFPLFLLACADNLILQATRTERWLMLGLSLAGLLGSVVILLKTWRVAGRDSGIAGKKKFDDRLVVYFIGFVILLETGSILANTYGRYNLAKTCLTNGYLDIVIGVLFLRTLRFIHAALSLAGKAYDIGERKFFYITFSSPEGKPRPVFYILLVLGWFVLFSRNLYIYKTITDPIGDFIGQERTIGNFSFTVGNVILFFLILYLSALVSRIVSFFAFDRYSAVVNRQLRKGVGSWLLIIRIFIISTGLLVAFATIGIPMDRLTIILSALGVGIGFGLQTLVNNLVSGLILSFEKPVNVGDFIEIAGRSGTVRSIGFRSSILSLGNGSQVVIPNGDLLNQHLVNWTHDNASRTIDIPVSVAFGTDLGKAIQLLKKLPATDERVLSGPEPVVLIRQFNSSSIDMQLTFWVRDMGEAGAVKTDILVEMDKTFRENNIEIPFPQQDLHIHSVT